MPTIWKLKSKHTILHSLSRILQSTWIWTAGFVVVITVLAWLYTFFFIFISYFLHVRMCVWVLALFHCIMWRSRAALQSQCSFTVGLELTVRFAWQPFLPGLLTGPSLLDIVLVFQDDRITHKYPGLRTNPSFNACLVIIHAISCPLSSALNGPFAYWI